MAASEQMKTLAKKKDDIENEIAELSEVLESQKGVGMDGPLVDAEGYPRSDIDVYTVRHARHKIACLQTDHKLVMTEIEDELHRIHADLRKQNQCSGDSAMDVTTASPAQSPGPQKSAFVRVDRVDAGSPAADAGVEIGDEVIAFGSVTADNFTSLKQIAEVVQHSIGRRVKVKVVRDGQTVSLSLTPGPWSGRGNLGCNVVAIQR